MLIGFKPHHPQGTNHWGTSSANSALVNIANTYKNQFYPNGIPNTKKLQYNDQSLTDGGKFDLGGDWSIGGYHVSHRDGTNADVSSHNVDLHIEGRREAIEELFSDYGATGVLPRLHQNHWHLTF